MRPLLFVLTLAIAAPALAVLPASFDWRDVDGVDYVSPHRNVGGCGATWIFGPVAVVEARLRIAEVRQGGALPDVDYSEQFILSCGSGYFGDFSCNGGYSKDVLTHIRDNGVPPEECYNYIASDQPCPVDCPDSGGAPDLRFPVTEVHEASAFPDDAVLMQEILDNGPVAVTMDLYQDVYSYVSGVYRYTSGDWVGATVLTVVGWGDDGGTPYWICRNAWGTGWGDGGDILVHRSADHAGCEFGEWAWWATVDTAAVPAEAASVGRLKSLFR